MIITTAQIIHSTLLKIIFAIFLLFITLAFVLARGVTIDHIELPGFEISEFYIKLDKKLIIEIGELRIEGKRGGNGPSLHSMNRLGKALRLLPVLFEKIRIDNASIGGKTVHILFFEDLFYIETDDIQLATRIYFDEKRKILFSKIETLHLLRPELSLSGKFAYETKSGIWKGEGEYSGLNLDGNFSIWQKGDLIGFDIDSDPTDSIQPLVDFLNPPEPIKVWIYPKIPAKKYILHHFRGTVRLGDDGKVLFDPEKVEGFATAYDAKIHFHPKVPPVKTKRIDVTYKHNILAFKLYRPLFEKKRLDGSRVRIRNLVPVDGRPCELDAHIVVRDRFDRSIQKILEAYHIPVPFIQTKGTLDATVDLTIALVNGRVVSYRGDYRTESAELLFDGVLPVPVKNLHVLSRDKKVTIEKCFVTLNPYLDASLRGVIDLAGKRGDFHVTVENLKYGVSPNLPLFHIKDRPLHVTMDFRKKIVFEIPDLHTTVGYGSGGKLYFSAENLRYFKPFFDGPLRPIEGGTLTIDYDGKAIEGRGTILYPNDILSYRNLPIHRFDIDFHASSEKIVAKINEKIHLMHKEKLTTIDFEKIDIRLMQLREFLKPYIREMGTKKAETPSSSSSQLLRIHAKESVLYTNFARVPCDAYQVKITTANPFSILFESQHGSGKINAILYNDDIKIVGKHLPDRVIHGIPALKELHGGYFDFDAIGTMEDIRGTIVVRRTLWAKSPIYNNILAALNSVPAILMLKNPGFSSRGFKIDKGVIKYRYRPPLFTFEKIDIHGKSANIFGKGTIDFERERIHVKMRIKFLETISKTMKKVPVAGYILFGKDGTISIGLSVEGSMKDPKVKTSAAKDILEAPINIIKRTFTFPFHLFGR
ncbi:YhdP family protein [Hydrogenimonas sp.]